MTAMQRSHTPAALISISARGFPVAPTRPRHLGDDSAWAPTKAVASCDKLRVGAGSLIRRSPNGTS